MSDKIEIDIQQARRDAAIMKQSIKEAIDLFVNKYGNHIEPKITIEMFKRQMSLGKTQHFVTVSSELIITS